MGESNSKDSRSSCFGVPAPVVFGGAFGVAVGTLLAEPVSGKLIGCSIGAKMAGASTVSAIAGISRNVSGTIVKNCIEKKALTNDIVSEGIKGGCVGAISGLTGEIVSLPIHDEFSHYHEVVSHATEIIVRKKIESKQVIFDGRSGNMPSFLSEVIMCGICHHYMITEDSLFTRAFGKTTRPVCEQCKEKEKAETTRFYFEGSPLSYINIKRL